MLKKQTLLLLFMFNLQGMEQKHHNRSRSNSKEFITINISPPKKDEEDKMDKKEDRKNQLKIAGIAAAAATVAAGLTAAVTLTIHFTECKN